MVNINDLEKGIRAVVVDLNKNGQHTLMSCHGHEGSSSSHCIRAGNKIKDDTRVQETGRGWITFNERGFNKNLVLSLLKKYGLKRIKVYPPNRDHIISVTFTKTR